MVKRRRNWAGDSLDVYKVTGKISPKADSEVSYSDLEIESDDKQFLDDAHEALSRLYTKSSKRERQLRGVRRKDAWQ